MAKRNTTNKVTEIIPVKPFLEGERETMENLSGSVPNDDSIADKLFLRNIASNIEKPCLTLKNCIFSGVFFIECKFNMAQISDVRFENCDLSNVSFAGSSMHRVEFISCKLVGTNFSETTLNNVFMRECNGHYINLSMSKITRTKFSGCDFKSGSLNNIRLDSVAFDSCTLMEADFSHTPLRGIDLTTSRLEGMQINIPDLRGATVSNLQAMDLIPLLGVRIKESFD